MSSKEEFERRYEGKKKRFVQKHLRISERISTEDVENSSEMLKLEYDILTSMAGENSATYVSVLTNSCMIQISQELMQKGSKAIESGETFETYETDKDSIVLKLSKDYKDVYYKVDNINRLQVMAYMGSHFNFILPVYAFGVWPYTSGDAEYADRMRVYSEILPHQKFPTRVCYLQKRCDNSLCTLLYHRINSRNPTSSDVEFRSRILGGTLEFVNNMTQNNFYTFHLDPYSDLAAEVHDSGVSLKLFSANTQNILYKDNKQMPGFDSDDLKILMLIVLSLQLVILSRNFGWRVNYLSTYFNSLPGGLVRIQEVHARACQLRERAYYSQCRSLMEKIGMRGRNIDGIIVSEDIKVS